MLSKARTAKTSMITECVCLSCPNINIPSKNPPMHAPNTASMSVGEYTDNREKRSNPIINSVS